MPHTAVPASELTARLNELRRVMSATHPDWKMILLDNKIDLYYFTGTMQEGALVITPDEAMLFVRHSYECAVRDSRFPDIRPLGSFRGIASAFPEIPETVYVAARTMTLQKLTMLQKYLPFAPSPIDGILSGLRSVKSEYELDCMRHAGKIHAKVLETVAPALLRPGLSEARLCAEICTSMLDHGAMCISRYNQPAAEDVLGFSSFSENSLLPAALDGPSGTVGTCIAMKSVGSTERLLRGGDTVLLDIPCGWRGYHTDKSITFYFGDLDENPKADLIRAAHEQAVALEKLTAELMRPGAVPAEIYAKVLEAVEPTFRDDFMNGCKFLGHSIGLTMDESPVLAKGFNEPLETGMTIAVEPKIALPGIGLIGTENTYEVVADGPAKSLTGACETGLEINY